MGRPAKLVPFPYQTECVDVLVEHFVAGANRALVVMASGLGKTLTVAFYLEYWFAALEGRVLFILDQGDPLFQTHREFDRVLARSGIAFGFWTGRLKTKNADTCEVLFTTFQTMRIHKERFGPDAFDLMVVDEAHHGQAISYRKVIEYFKAKRIGLTATPEREDGRDIRELFGEPVYELSLASALSRRLLAQVDYRLMHDNLDILKLREYIRRVIAGDRTVSRRQLDDTLFLEERSEAIAAKVKEAQAGRKKTIIFCRSLEHLAEVQRFFSDARPFHSDVSKRERDDTYRAFRDGELHEIQVVNMFNECMDVPSAELLVFWRATDSKRIWLQQLGRGLRGRQKTVVVLDFVANCDRILAVKELGLETTRHSGAGMPDPIRVATGLKIAYTEELLDVIKLLDRLEAEFYPTWEEASAAAQKLKPRPMESRDYTSLYRLDSRLPSSPYTFYASVWKANGAWPGFLGVNGVIPRKAMECYPTWEEASAAAQKLKPRPQNVDDYLSVYRCDPRLPSNPAKVYASVWKANGAWPGFLDMRRRRGNVEQFYPTWEEASAAAQRLNPRPTGAQAYKRRYRQNPQLHCSPNRLYVSVWDVNGGWPGFLHTSNKRMNLSEGKDFYQTWEEAAAALSVLNPYPENKRAYKDVRKQDPSLPSDPERVYASVWKANGSWPGFLGTKDNT